MEYFGWDQGKIKDDPFKKDIDRIKKKFCNAILNL